MKVQALRGVCVGVGRHLRVGDFDDLDADQVTFLVGIGAVAVVPDEVASAMKAPKQAAKKPAEPTAHPAPGTPEKKEK